MANHTRPSRGFGTLAVHAGQKPDPVTGAIMTPVYQTSTFVQKAPAEHRGYEYARVSNPTRTALEKNLAALEGAAHGICFASGMAALDAMLKRLRPGDHVLGMADIYAGTIRLFREVFEPYGLTFNFVDMTDLQAVEAAVRPETKLVWIETPTNPLLRVVDIAAVSEIAHASGIDVAVDNTFASPFLQQPLALGADMSLHSTTKYLGGHSDVIGGAVLTNDDAWAENLRFQVKASGAAPAPLDCFLVLRSTKTLHLRMERHCRNARAIAAFLREHPKVGRVHYPGLPDDPGYGTAREQMLDFGGMLSFSLTNDRKKDAVRMMADLRIVSLAESLGGVESLIEHPATMTHAFLSREERQAFGITDSLMRLSVGVEEEADLIADLDAALSAA